MVDSMSVGGWGWWRREGRLLVGEMKIEDVKVSVCVWIERKLNDYIIGIYSVPTY